MWTYMQNVLVGKATDNWYGGSANRGARHRKRAKKGGKIQTGEGNSCIKQREGMGFAGGFQFRSERRDKILKRTGTETAEAGWRGGGDVRLLRTSVRHQSARNRLG